MKMESFQRAFQCQRGVSVITAVFLLLLFGVLAALMANVISTSHTTSAADVLGARAYQSARAVVEWGLYRVLQAPAPGDTVIVPGVPGTACVNPVTLNNCPPPGFPVVDGLEVAVNCEVFPPAGYYEEGCRRIRIYRLTAKATGPGPAGMTVEREVQVTAERCQDASIVPADC